jgi:hypothetical protein
MDTHEVTTPEALVSLDAANTLAEARRFIVTLEAGLRGATYHTDNVEIARNAAYVAAMAYSAKEAIDQLLIAADVYLDASWSANGVLNG